MNLKLKKKKLYRFDILFKAHIETLIDKNDHSQSVYLFCRQFHTPFAAEEVEKKYSQTQTHAPTV